MKLINSLLILIIVTIVSLYFEKISKKIKIQRIVFELTLGILLGSTVLAGYISNSFIEQIAVLGSIILLFSVGFGSNFEHLSKRKKEIILLASAGVVLPFVLIYIFLSSIGIPILAVWFVSAAGVSTSVGITARILLETNNCDTDIGNIILGAAVLDDVYGIVLLTGLLALIRPIGFLSVGYALGAIFLFFAIISLLLIFKKWSKDKLSEKSRKIILTPSSVALPVLAATFGFSPVLGAFFSGLLLSRLEIKERYYKTLRFIYRIFVPIFFVYIGSQINIAQFLKMNIFIVGFLISLMVIIGQALAGLFLVTIVGVKKALTLGLGMLPRGEVALIIVTTGLGVGVVSRELFSVVLVMVFITTIIEPFVFPKLLSICATNKKPAHKSRSGYAD